MNSDLPKVLHPLCGRPLVHFVIDQAREVGSDRIVLVVGHKRDLVIEATKDMNVLHAVQEQQLGTGDAVRACIPFLQDYEGDTLILSGDVPLMRATTILEALHLHITDDAAATVFTFLPDSAQGYGRIVRGENGELVRIVEHKDATPDERLIDEVNGGIYFFKNRELFNALQEIGNDNAAGEYYITDTISILRNRGRRVSAYLVADPMEMDGVNTVDQLAALEKEWLRRQGA